MFERIFGGLSHWATIPLRVAIGVIFAAHGWQKFSMGLDGVARFFGSVGIPLPEVSAFIVAFVELVGGIGLIVGVFTRYWALLLSIVMIVAIFTVKLQGGLLGAQGRPGYEFDLALLAGCLALLLTGPGPISLERAIFQKEL
jgi:putative oxidoreductase